MTIDEQLKQRIVGAVVITALAAIFVPMMIEEPLQKEANQVNELTIPEAPKVVAPTPPVDMQSSDTETNVNSNVSAAAASPEDLAVDDESISAEVSPEVLAAEAESDRIAAERFKQELVASGAVAKGSKQVDAHHESSKEASEIKALASKKPKETSEQLKPVKDKTAQNLAERIVEEDNAEPVAQKLQVEKKIIKPKSPTLSEKKPFAEEDRHAEFKPLSKKTLSETAKINPKTEAKVTSDEDFKGNPSIKAKEQLLNDQIQAFKKAQEAAIIEKQNAENLAKKLESEKAAKQKELSDKANNEKLVQQQVEEYRKQIEKKVKEKEQLEKQAAAKAVAEEKVAAKKQAVEDKAALPKIAADKKAVEQAAAEGKNADSPTPSRWFVRMGSFSKEANANALRDKLRKDGYPAVVDIVKTPDKGTLYRLRVGPDLSKERAEKIRQKLDSENKASSILELE